ncbi:hypothetical protein [Nocardiopsis halophila]|uniref:hypothetical protein n=1 Tax=Nocardiopsis halophila TaxID=141692 RepID=UPI0003465151|nr:hypothetical protein [Nocardiopsis halophila]
MWLGIGAAAGVVFGAVGFAALSSVDWSGMAGGPALEQAAKECGLNDGSAVRVKDEGRTLALETAGTDASGLRFAEVECVLEVVGAPDHVVEAMMSTRALDGRQSQEWEGFEAQWSYHPDSGMSVLLRQT